MPPHPAVSPRRHVCPHSSCHSRRLLTLSFSQLLAGIQRKRPGRPAPGRGPHQRPWIPLATGMTQEKGRKSVILSEAKNLVSHSHGPPTRHSHKACPPVIPTGCPPGLPTVCPPVLPSGCSPVIPAVFSGNPEEVPRTPGRPSPHHRRVPDGEKPWIPVCMGMARGEAGYDTREGKRKGRRGKGVRKGEAPGPAIGRRGPGRAAGAAGSGGGEILRFAQNDRAGGMTRGERKEAARHYSRFRGAAVRSMVS